jgi:hypothetical protein
LNEKGGTKPELRAPPRRLLFAAEAEKVKEKRAVPSG